MSINQELANIISNLDDNSLLNNSLQIKELLYSGAVLDDSLSEALFVSSVELLEKIKTNPNNYTINSEQIAAINNIISKMELSFMDLE
ncbi:hypothetical protein [Brachyspira murdochii]|uniref:Uncharacterized protein n=2 Tax=Brachyspira murdochii TaxID=84378 RepID=D5UB86_BRAM5|nr:hypothetical protein [Brachyspira murdochii]ADG71959.1 conserved hypothetical protein [Brachyspira murdochii DSM 12563]PPS23059.1 hypothetical protein DJ52_01475 [Brachyspira murdochii]